ncbi:uncharacterized protein CLUP02_00146 [Colletotrichum lupini]|uniref:Uncharacterized protein n=1 Tax=Colletotrichum lupini TaxID=145971 RepID=A0A9Q8S961_9PEZI|nr:uncharacterized protein CLUP02_00146 [Colletotrichum lupini]UQC73501.1 hypothetical protein CLUP02_00146 [Colletotrichum lupini]
MQATLPSLPHEILRGSLPLPNRLSVSDRYFLRIPGHQDSFHSQTHSHSHLIAHTQTRHFASSYRRFNLPNPAIGPAHPGCHKANSKASLLAQSGFIPQGPPCLRRRIPTQTAINRISLSRGLLCTSSHSLQSQGTFVIGSSRECGMHALHPLLLMAIMDEPLLSKSGGAILPLSTIEAVRGLIGVLVHISDSLIGRVKLLYYTHKLMNSILGTHLNLVLGQLPQANHVIRSSLKDQSTQRLLSKLVRRATGYNSLIPLHLAYEMKSSVDPYDRIIISAIGVDISGIRTAPPLCFANKSHFADS